MSTDTSPETTADGSLTISTSAAPVPVTGTPTTHARLAAWVKEVAALTTPAAIHWCDGSDEEWAALTDALVETGTFTRLDETRSRTRSTARSDPTDVARVEDRTYICSVDEKDAGPTNNWMAPDEMKAIMTDLYRGSMSRAHAST